VVDTREGSADTEAALLATDLHVEATNRLVEALVESENRMRRRVELLADAVIETDSEGALVFLNRAWTSLTGHATADCLGRRVSDFFPPESRPDLDRVLACRTGEHQELTTRLRRTDGRAVHVVLTTSPMSMGGVVAVLRDITREHEYQQELSKLSVVASSTSNLVVITDALGMIDWVNPAFEKRTGYTLGEVQGRKPGDVLQGPDTDPVAVDRLRAAIHERRSASEDLLNYTKTGEPYWVTVNLTPVLDAAGRLERFISVQADITERNRVERMKTEFVSTVSHELRTPLTAITGSLGLVNGGIAGALPEAAVRLLEIAASNGERLTVLINDLLDMESLVQGGIPIHSQVQPLMPIVDQAVADHQPYADRCEVRLALGEHCDKVVVDVEGRRLAQVLSNLLSNACKFAPAGSTVDVSVRCAVGTARISITDRGPGVPESFRDSIFQKFSQADASDTRPLGGTGLGLAISKELVERMGGAIGYDSVEGHGATFFVDLPVADAGS
jgi:PAS domain S-box-containing protein